jgi:hypothetical protein
VTDHILGSIPVAGSPGVMLFQYITLALYPLIFPEIAGILYVTDHIK